MPLAALSAASACIVHDWVEARIVQKVAAEFDAGHPSATALDVTGNPKGEGFVVFARSEVCAPAFMWMAVSDGDRLTVYAVDAASQALTPRLDLLTSAPAPARKRLGVDAESFGRVMRDELCRQERPSSPHR